MTTLSQIIDTNAVYQAALRQIIVPRLDDADLFARLGWLEAHQDEVDAVEPFVWPDMRTAIRVPLLMPTGATLGTFHAEHHT